MSQFVDSFIFLFGGLLLLGGLLKLGRLIGGRKSPWLAVGLPIVGFIGAAFAGDWALTRFGVAGKVAVVHKTEWVWLAQNGVPVSSVSITTKQAGTPVGETVNFRTDQASYDAVAMGDSVTIRALPFRPSVARLEVMTWDRWLAIVQATGLPLIGVGFLATVVGLILYGGVGAIGSARKTAALILFVGGGFACWKDGKPYSGPTAPNDPLSVRATITRLRTVRGLYPLSFSTSPRRGWGLRRPFTVVEARFTPAGFRSPVTGVDAIDAESVPKLAEGDRVEIRYDRRHPRLIRLIHATRRWPD